MTGRVAPLLGDVLLIQGKLDEARDLYVRALDARVAVSGEASDEAKNIHDRLARLERFRANRDGGAVDAVGR